jgi:hypothetical protein
MRELIRQYLETALWSSVEGDEGTPMDKAHDIADFAPEAIAQAETDCTKFEEKARSLLDAAGVDDSQAGHDFWLTRNGRGVGFWDRGNGLVGDSLAAIAHEFGETDAYTGDDGKVYFSR